MLTMRHLLASIALLAGASFVQQAKGDVTFELCYTEAFCEDSAHFAGSNVVKLFPGLTNSLSRWCDASDQLR
jgi:hypothetical protein